MSGSSTSRTGTGRPSWSTSCRSSRRSPTTSPSSTCRSCRSGSGRCSASWAIRLIEVPDEEFATLGCNVLAVRPGVVIVAEGNPRTAAALAAAGCEVHTYPGHRDRHQRLRRADLHDPADPAWLTGRGRPSTATRLVADLRALVRIPSITGSEEAVAAWAAEALRELGLAVEVVSPRLAAIRGGPRLAGRGDAADLAAGRHRAGRPGRRAAAHPVGSPRRRAAGRPRDVDGRSVGRRGPRRRAVRPRRVRHEGRRRGDPRRRPGARQRPATSTVSTAS